MCLLLSRRQILFFANFDIAGVSVIAGVMCVQASSYFSKAFAVSCY